MRKHTHQKAYYYTFKSGIFIYTARPKRKGAEPESVAYIQRTREAIKKENDRTNALIENLKEDMHKTRTREEHDRLVDIMTTHIQLDHRISMVPAPNSFITPDQIFY